MENFCILSLMFWILLQGLIQETIAVLNSPEIFTPSPRPGIHYVIIPNTDYFIDDPQSKCPSGSSLTYIKSQEEWEDWKAIRGRYLY